MKPKKERKVGIKFAQGEFNTIGLILCLYIICVLYLPIVLHYYMNITADFDFFLQDQYLVVGLYYIISFIGTLFIVLFLVFSCKINLNEVFRKSLITTEALFNETIVFCAIGTACLFAAMAINTYIPIGSGIISPIGMAFASEYYNSYLYLFIFAIASPIMEEIVFRGVLFRSLGRYGHRFALYMTAIIYALMHVSIAEMIPAFILSVFLSNVTMHYRSIQPTIVIHVAFKSLLTLITFAPKQLYYVLAIALFAIYVYALYLALHKRYRFTKLKSRKNTNLVYRLFLTRPSVIAAFVLLFSHSIAILLLGWVV